MIAWHMGALHAYEKYLTFGLAFGPFVLMALVVFWRRRQDVAEENAALTETVEQTQVQAQTQVPAPEQTPVDDPQRANHS